MLGRYTINMAGHLRRLEVHFCRRVRPHLKSCQTTVLIVPSFSCQTVFQFAYTTLFGFHCAFLFVRSGSVIPPLFAHIFCNIMGVPQLQAELKWHIHHRTRTSLMMIDLMLIPLVLVAHDACVLIEIKIAYGLGIALYIYSMRYWTLVTEDRNLFWDASIRGRW